MIINFFKTKKKQSFRGSHLNNLDFDDAGVGSSSSYNPFEDSNEVEYDPVVSGPSAKALGWVIIT